MSGEHFDYILKYFTNMGFQNPTYDLIKAVAERDQDYLLSYAQENIPHIEYNDKSRECSIVVDKVTLALEEPVCFSKGSYSSIRSWKSKYDCEKIQVRKGHIVVEKYNNSSDLSKENRFISSFIEAVIHATLTAFQELYNGDTNTCIVVPLATIAYDTKENIIVMFMPYADSDCGSFINEYDKNTRFGAILDVAFYTAIRLKILQDYFHFVHYDMKANNILHKKENDMRNTFLLCDFGSSRINFKNHIISGITFSNQSHSEYNRDRDMFQFFIISAAFQKRYVSREIEQFVKAIKDIDFTNYRKKDNKWLNSYLYKSNDNKFTPENIIKVLCNEFPNRYNVKEIKKFVGSHFFLFENFLLN